MRWELSLQARTDHITATAMTPTIMVVVPIITAVVPTITGGPTIGITADTTDIGDRSDRGRRKKGAAQEGLREV